MVCPVRRNHPQANQCALSVAFRYVWSQQNADEVYHHKAPTETGGEKVLHLLQELLYGLI